MSPLNWYGYECGSAVCRKFSCLNYLHKMMIKKATVILSTRKSMILCKVRHVVIMWKCACTQNCTRRGTIRRGYRRQTAAEAKTALHRCRYNNSLYKYRTISRVDAYQTYMNTIKHKPTIPLQTTKKHRTVMCGNMFWTQIFVFRKEVKRCTLSMFSCGFSMQHAVFTTFARSFAEPEVK